MLKKPLAIAFICTVVLSANYAQAQENSNCPPQSRFGDLNRIDREKAFKISNENREIINQYYQNARFKNGVGIAIGEKFPENFEWQYIPDELLNKIGRYPGADYIIYGRKVYLVGIATGIVIDVTNIK